MAIRTNDDALQNLFFDLRERAMREIVPDAELLRSSMPMMKIENYWVAFAAIGASV